MKNKIIGLILLLTGAIQINAQDGQLELSRSELKKLQKIIPATQECLSLSMDVADGQFPPHITTFEAVKDWLEERVEDNCKLEEKELKEELNEILMDLQRAEKNKADQSTSDNDSSETTEGLKADIVTEVGDYVVMKKPQNVKWTSKVSNFFRNLFGNKEK